MQSNATRRQFVTALGTAGAAAAIAAGTTAAFAEEGGTAAAVALGDANVNFTQETTLLVVGAGISGLFAAYDAAAAGIQTLIVEQNGFAGGDTIYSAACMMNSMSELTREQRPEKYFTYEEMCGMFAAAYPDDEEGLHKTIDQHVWGGKWMDRLHYEWGYEFQPRMECPYLQAFFPRDGIGSMPPAFEVIVSKVEEAGAQFLFDTTLKTLIADETGAIVGARFTTRDGALLDIKAQATVIATGGYASNQEWMTQYAPETADVACIVSGRTGEGIKAGLAAGGTLWNMVPPGNLNPRYEAGHMLGVHYPIICLLPNGKRFYCETAVHNCASGCLNAGSFQWWTIWDDVAQNGVDQAVIRNAGDNVKIANTIEELAEGMGMALETLQAAFDNWAQICANQEDPEFGRVLFLQELQPPYYYLLNYPVRYKSKGGLATSSRYEVIDAQGNPIPGLYACGCAAGTEDIVPAGGSGMCLSQTLIEDLA